MGQETQNSMSSILPFWYEMNKTRRESILTFRIKYGLRQTSFIVGSTSSSLPGRKWINVCNAISAAVTGGFLGNWMNFVAACIASI